MNRLGRIHRRKTLQRVDDLKARVRGRRIPNGFSLAKHVDPTVFKTPLNISQMEIPPTHED